MKTEFMFVMLACVGLLCATGHAGLTALDQQQDRSGGLARPNAQRSRRGVPAGSNLPKPLPRRQTHAASAGAMNPRRHPNGSSPLAAGVIVQNPTAGRYPHVRSPGPVRAAAPPLSSVRHRSPNPAVIGGSTDLGKRNSGAIDGKQAHRRP